MMTRTGRVVIASMALLGVAAGAIAAPAGSITSPAPGSCLCGTGLVPVVGTAMNVGAGTYISDTLEYSTNPGTGPWTLIGNATAATGTSPVQIYNWNVNSLPGGTYFLRLTVRGTDASGAATTAVAISQTFIERTPPALPVIVGVTNGGRYFDRLNISIAKADRCSGLLSPVLDYRNVDTSGPWVPISTTDAGTYVRTSFNINLLPQGNYQLRASFADACGNTATSTVSFINDNLTAGAAFAAPAANSFVRGIVPISGSASGAGLTGWRLEYSTQPGLTVWNPIATGTSAVTGTLGVWDTTSLPTGSYILRLTVNKNSLDRGGNDISREEFRVVNVGCAGDFNRDSVVDVPDIFAFLSAWFAGCP